MRTTHRYADPTGGGDDIMVTIPAWVVPPEQLIIYDINHERHIFEYAEEED